MESNEDLLIDTCRGVWYPNRVITFWDMKDFKAETLFRLITSIGAYATGLSQLTEAYDKILSDYLKSEWRNTILRITVFGAQSLSLGCGSASRKARAILKEIEATDFPTDPLIQYRLSAAMQEMVDRLHGDLEVRMSVIIETSDTEFYAENQFAGAILSGFPGAEYDMIEAGKCLALDRATACVFHISRIVEAGLRTVRQKYGFRPCHSWSQYSSEIKNVIDERLGSLKSISDHNSPEAITIDREILALRELWEKVDNSKHRWRNDTIHSERRYEKAEAREIIETVKTLMECIATNFL